ncbi:MAG: hypothetical protein ACK5NB_04605 [Flavobacteriaceae bacterium]
MKKLLVITAVLCFLLQSCGGNSSFPTLSNAEDLIKAQSMLQEKFSAYDGKLLSVYFSTDDKRNQTVDIISVRFMKDAKEYNAVFTPFTEVMENESKVPFNEPVKEFSLSDIKLSDLSNALGQATVQITEKDAKFSTFRVRTVSYETDSDSGQLEVTFDVIAKHPEKSYFGKRTRPDSDDFTFSFKLQNGNVVATSGLVL